MSRRGKRIESLLSLQDAFDYGVIRESEAACAGDNIVKGQALIEHKPGNINDIKPVVDVTGAKSAFVMVAGSSVYVPVERFNHAHISAADASMLMPGDCELQATLSVADHTVTRTLRPDGLLSEVAESMFHKLCSTVYDRNRRFSLTEMQDMYRGEVRASIDVVFSDGNVHHWSAFSKNTSRLEGMSIELGRRLEMLMIG